MFPLLFVALTSYGYWRGIEKANDTAVAMVAINASILNTLAQSNLPGPVGVFASVVLSAIVVLLIGYISKGSQAWKQ